MDASPRRLPYFLSREHVQAAMEAQLLLNEAHLYGLVEYMYT